MLVRACWLTALPLGMFALATAACRTSDSRSADAAADHAALGVGSDAGEDGSTRVRRDAGRGSGRDAHEAGAADGSAGLDGSLAPDAPGDGPPKAEDGPPSAPDARGSEKDASADGNTCTDGTPVAYSRTSCSTAATPVPAGLSGAATSASVGEIISLRGLDEGAVACFPVRVCVAPNAPTLIFSDDPESPSSDGILYADQLGSGNYRAYVYHTNGGQGHRAFPVVLLNEGATTVHATIRAQGVAGPSSDYVDVGKQALFRWLTSEGNISTVDVAPGQRVVLSTTLAALSASTNALVHGIIDFSLDGSVKLSVVSILSSEDPVTVTAGLGLLPNDGAHVRGTFPGAALEIETIGVIDTSGARHLRLGGNVTDAYLTGRDYVDATQVTLEGNYGVSYELSLSIRSGTSGDLAMLLSPQGGAWGGVGTVGGLAPTLLPASQDSLGTQGDALGLGASNGATTERITLLSAGGSSLPVDLVTLPSATQ